MFRHLLVPVDDTEASVDLVASAVNLAACWRANVTFLHTREHAARSDHGAFTRSSAAGPQAMSSDALAKAEAAARAWGVPSHSVRADAGNFSVGIANAARQQGCDLILLAPNGIHGTPGAPLDDNPIKAIQLAGLPVLVAAAAADAPSAFVIGALRAEHRLLATILQAWGQVLISETAAPVDLMQSILDLVGRLETQHLHKEDELFQRLRARTSAVNPDLDELSHQHAREDTLLSGLADRVQAHAESLSPDQEAQTRSDLQAALSEYVRFMWDHLGREEAVVLAEARRHLHDADWNELRQAFLRAQTQASDQETSRLLNDVLHRVGEIPHRPPHQERGTP